MKRHLAAPAALSPRKAGPRGILNWKAYYDA